MNSTSTARFRYITLFLLAATFLSCSPVLTHQIAHQEQVIVASENAIDSAIYKIIVPYRDSLKLVMDKPIGESSGQIPIFKPESPLSNFTADLLLEAGIKFIKEHGEEPLPSVAVVNIKGLRAPIPKGVVTVGDIFKVMPFENSLVAVQLNSQQMQKLFNHMVSEGGDGLAGASFTMQPPNKAANILVQNEKLNSNQLYWVITSNYIADGGDHYTIFRESKKIIISPYSIRDLIIDKVKEFGSKTKPIEYSTEIRIKKIEHE